MASEPRHARRRGAAGRLPELRITPRRRGSNVATLTPYPTGPTPTAPQLRAIVEELGHDGYVSVFTAALSADAVEPYLDAGFTVHEQLHLLEHTLTGIERPTTGSLRRARRSDIDRVLTIDTAAFEPFWRLDRDGIDEARTATPSHRFRVGIHHPTDGYAIWGRSGRTGYLQRLAVHPEAGSRGLGTTLVRDGLWWAARKGSGSVLVNTQARNHRAFQLYRQLGFEPRPDGLVVLGRPIAAASR